MISNLEDLYYDQIRDLYSAETQLLEALPALCSAAMNDDLRQALSDHLAETREQRQRQANIWTRHGVAPEGTTCEAMRGLIREARETVAKYGDPYVIDAALIANAQRVAHYQIAGYGTARQFAKVIGEDRVADIFGDLVRHAGNVDQRLSKVATGGWFARGVNQRAETV